MGQTARVLLKEAVQEGVPAAEDSDDDAANPLWGQREDKQIQVGALRCDIEWWLSRAKGGLQGQAGMEVLVRCPPSEAV